VAQYRAAARLSETADDADPARAIARLRRGDLGGLEPLVRVHQVEATRAAYLIVRDAALAQDIVQTVFVRLAERIHQYDPSRPFKPYLLRSVVNDAIKAVEKANRQVSLDAPVSAVDEVSLIDLLPDDALDPAAAYERDEIRRLVWDALDQLPAKARAAAVMRYFLGWSEAEMAEALGVSVGTVKWRLHDARTRLSKLLAPLVNAIVLNAILYAFALCVIVIRGLTR